MPTLNPNPLAFGNVKVGQNKTLNLTVTNNSAVALTVSSIAASGSVFTVSPTSLNLPANGTGTIAITFTPTSREADTATLTLGYSTSSGSAQVTATLTGQGIQPAISVVPSDTLRFGDVNVETEKSRVLPLILYNTGNDTLTINEVVRPSGVFSVAAAVPPAISLKGGDSTRVNMIYTPTAIRPDTASVTIRSNAANNPILRLGLSGRGTLVGFALRPDTLDFGRVRLTEISPQSLVISNTGNDTLKVAGISRDNQRFSVSDSSFNVLPNNTKTIEVRFTPTQVDRDERGQLIFATNIGTGGSGRGKDRDSGDPQHWWRHAAPEPAAV